MKFSYLLIIGLFLTINCSFGQSNNQTNGSQQSIQITGERIIHTGKPAVLTRGITIGIKPQSEIFIYGKLPGQTRYTVLTRTKINSDGEFKYIKKSSKKIYIYATDKSGKIKSNRIVVKAR